VYQITRHGLLPDGSADSAFWKNKCIIITGASSGIGEALSTELVARGAKVGLIARRQEKLEMLTSQLKSDGSQVAFATADVTDAKAVTNATTLLESSLGPCDILIANAGIYHKTDVLTFDAAKENAVIATNTQGVINSIATVLPGMISRKSGHVVAVSSIAAMVGLPAAASYSASKAALVTFFQSLRVDLHSHGIKATIAAPGFVDTPLITEEERETIKDLITAEQAAKRICYAIRHNRSVDWFPWQTWLVCRLLSFLPSGLYRRAVAHIPEMEETHT
jgi:short-subunit dehydrogenase